jgi:cytochrome c553
MRAPLIAAVLLLAALPVRAEDEGASLFAAKGCPACHGAEGRAPAALTPALAGQNQTYLWRKMDEIADGSHTAPAADPMRPVIQDTSADERRVMSLWLASRPPMEPETADAAQVEAGELLFADKACSGCHGEAGNRPFADYPALAGQRSDYLALQIKAIRDEVRAGRRPRLMIANVRTLKDAEVEQLARYLAQAQRK